MNREKESEVLKPCPFCGGEAEFERTGTSLHSCIVSCTNCGARHESGDEDGNSGRSWNMRAALSTEAQPEVMGAVATVYVGENDFGPFDFKVTPYGCDKLPEGETKLYATTQQLTDTVTISSQEYEALKADKARMDFLSDEKSVYWIQISRQPEGTNIFNSNRVSKLRDIIDEVHNGLLIK